MWWEDYTTWSRQEQAPDDGAYTQRGNIEANPIVLLLNKMQAAHREEFRANFEKNKPRKPDNVSARIWEAQQEDLFESSVKQNMPKIGDATIAYRAQRNEQWKEEKKNRPLSN